MFSSTIQVLKIEDEERASKKTGDKYQFFVARSILLADDGSVINVGTLRVPEALRSVCQVGTFRASFALQVPEWGQQKGEIVAVLTGLTPVPVGRASAVPAVSSATK